MEDFKYRSEVVKLITSSLFARKQPFMIVNGNTPGLFYYTNIEPSRVGLYRPTIEDVLSQVTITSEKILDEFYSAFPKFKEIIAVINLTKFSTARNKLAKCLKDKFPEMIVDEGTSEIILSVGVEDKFVVGNLISDHTIMFYKEIIDKYNSFSDNLVKRKFKATQISGDDKVTLEIVDVESSDGNKHEFGYPVRDGTNIVSVKEYVNKRKMDPFYDISMMVNDISKTAKAVISYTDDWLSASTMMPGSLWFI